MKWKEFIDLKLEEWALMLMIIFMVLLVFLQVLSRYVFNVSIGWSSELSRYCLIWITWISASYVIRIQEHIRIMTLVDYFNEKVQKAIEVFVVLCWFIFALVMAVIGTDVFMGIKQMGQKTSTLQWPMWVIYIIIPITGCLMMIRLIQQLYFIFKKPIEGSDSV